MKRVAFCALSLLLFVAPAAGADKWLSIHTRNFLLAGNASESDIRRIGRTLEEFRSAAAIMFPAMDQTSTTPTTILVFKNDDSFNPYKPLYQGKPSNLLAFFQPGEDVNYIALTASTAAPEIVLHEYMHFLLRENVGGLPLWISEGLAECYSTFEFGGRSNDLTIGKPPQRHIDTFRSSPQFIPLKRLLEINDKSPEYNEQQMQGMFYAESWAIVHYLIFGPDAKRRTQFVQLLTSLSQGERFEDAFPDAFQTSFGEFEEEVRNYIRNPNGWTSTKVTSRAGLEVDVRALNPKTLTPAESDFYLGDLLLHLNRIADAERLLSEALSADSRLTDAQVSLAVLRVRQRRYDDALALLKKAVDAGSNNYIVHFYYAYAMERADSDASAALADGAAVKYEAMRTYAKKAVELAPRFVQAYALLARIDLNAGQNLDEAEAMLKKALSVAPGRDDLQMLLADAYLRASRTQDARDVLSLIERSTADPDLRRRASDLLNQTEKTFTFTEITPAAVEDLPPELARPNAPASPATPPLPPPPAPRKAEETILEPLTPTGPNTKGEQLSGLLLNMDCSDGLTLSIRTSDATKELHSSDPQKIQFLSYTAAVAGDIKCGARDPAAPVTITYDPASNEPLVVEFTAPRK